jgi:hypothetical protein
MDWNPWRFALPGIWFADPHTDVLCTLDCTRYDRSCHADICGRPYYFRICNPTDFFEKHRKNNENPESRVGDLWCSWVGGLGRVYCWTCSYDNDCFPTFHKKCLRKKRHYQKKRYNNNLLLSQRNIGRLKRWTKKKLVAQPAGINLCCKGNPLKRIHCNNSYLLLCFQNKEIELFFHTIRNYFEIVF